MRRTRQQNFTLDLHCKSRRRAARISRENLAALRRSYRRAVRQRYLFRSVLTDRCAGWALTEQRESPVYPKLHCALPARGTAPDWHSAEGFRPSSLPRTRPPGAPGSVCTDQAGRKYKCAHTEPACAHYLPGKESTLGRPRPAHSALLIPAFRDHQPHPSTH